MNFNSVLIIDFGSQLSRLIARRVRELGVYCEIVPHTKAQKTFEKLSPCCVILSGGPSSVLQKNAPKVPEKILSSGVAILGICYGQQAMCHQLGGKVEAGKGREFGRAEIKVSKKSKLFEGIWQVGKSYPVWMSHGDRVAKLPKGFAVVAKSKNAPCAVAQDEAKKFYSTMFHPEVVHTPNGKKLLENFVCKIGGAKKNWTMKKYKESAIKKIKQQVGSKKIICGLSGGVDSSVAAVLVHKAVGKQLTCILVDHGLMRKDEAKQVVKMFKKHYNIKLICIDASKLFLKNLKGVIDPEKKRKIIGKLFIETFEKQAKKTANAEFLVQGTLYPDVIESQSVSGASQKIKSHHNVGGLPKKMNLKLVEPLRELFKDEVRNLGKQLKLPTEFIERHPFPGPGLALRCLGEINKKSLEMLRKADAIYIEEIKKANLYNKIWQAFAVLLPVKTVGVMGDSRTYEQVLALRAVTSQDGMTADFYNFKTELLGKISSRIINEVKGVNRVVYDTTSKPPATIEWE